MQTRRANINDLSTLSELFDLYRQFYRQPENVKASRAFVAQRLENQDSVFIITLDSSGQGAGFTQLYPSFSSVAMRKVWILNDLYVHESFRKKGVATSLIEFARDHAIETDAMGIKLATAKNNFNAQALYEKLGFKKITEFDYYTLVAK